MGLVRPQKGKSVGAGWHQVEIVDVQDVAQELNFSEIAIKFMLDFNGLTRDMLLAGDLERDADGNIRVEGNRLLNKWERTMDLLEVAPFVGFNEKGKFETETGQIIDDVCDYLKKKLSSGIYMAWIGYKKNKSGKYYEVVPVICSANKEKEALNYLNFLVNNKAIGILESRPINNDTEEDEPRPAFG